MNRRSCASRTKTRALGVCLIGAAGAGRKLLALADKPASLQLGLVLPLPPISESASLEQALIRLGSPQIAFNAAPDGERS